MLASAAAGLAAQVYGTGIWHRVRRMTAHTWPMQMESTRDMRGSARGMLMAGAAKSRIRLMSLRRQGHDPTSADCGSLDVLSSASCSRGRASSGRKLTDSPAHDGREKSVLGCTRLLLSLQVVLWCRC